jgi:cell division protein FtsX
MKPRLLIWAIAIFLSTAGASLGQPNAQTLSKAIEAKEKLLLEARDAARKAESAAREAADKLAEAHAIRKRAHQKAALDARAARGRVIAAAKDLAELREIAEKQAEEIGSLSERSAEAELALESAIAQLEALSQAIERERKLFEYERAVLVDKEASARLENRPWVVDWLGSGVSAALAAVFVFAIGRLKIFRYEEPDVKMLVETKEPPSYYTPSQPIRPTKPSDPKQP